MSGTQLPALSKEQRAWANAFLQLLGGTKMTQEPPKNRSRGKQPTPQTSELQGGLTNLETQVSGQFEQARRELSGEGENTRRKTTFGQSTDKGYREKVVDEVDRFIEEVDELIAQGEGGNLQSKAVYLRAQLNRQLTHYEEAKKKKSSKEKTRQRDQKIEAIQKRLDALDKFVTEGESVAQERLTQLYLLEPEARAKLLKENPDIRKAVVSGKPHADELALMLNQTSGDGQDAFVKDIIEIHSDDPDYLRQVCNQVLQLDTSNQQQNAFLRGNSGVTKLMTAFCKSQPDTQNLLSGIEEKARTWGRSAGRIEADDYKFREGENRDTIKNQSVEKIRAFLSSLLQDLKATPIPPEIKATSKMIAGEYKAKFPNASDDDVAKIIGGHIFLRVVSPKFAEIAGKMGTELVALEKKRKKNSPEYQQLEDTQRAILLAAKVLQSSSNNTPPDTKEPFMRIFTQVVNGLFASAKDYCLSTLEE